MKGFFFRPGLLFKIVIFTWLYSNGCNFAVLFPIADFEAVSERPIILLSKYARGLKFGWKMTEIEPFEHQLFSEQKPHISLSLSLRLCQQKTTLPVAKMIAVSDSPHFFGLGKYIHRLLDEDFHFSIFLVKSGVSDHCAAAPRVALASPRRGFSRPRALVYLHPLR